MKTLSTFTKPVKRLATNITQNSTQNTKHGATNTFITHTEMKVVALVVYFSIIANWYNFVTEVGNSFLDAYVPIIEKRKDLTFTKDQRNWQEIRRGRYVEFNLVHDKGTLFGLKTNGRIESILMSLPPHVQWVYDHHPEAGSEEERLIKVLQNPVDWI